MPGLLGEAPAPEHWGNGDPATGLEFLQIIFRSLPVLFVLGKCLQFLAGLEAYSLAGRDADFRPRTRVAADAGLARLYRKHAEATQFNAVVVSLGFLH